MRSRRTILVSFLLLAVTAITTNAQSQDRDNPTLLSADTIKGSGIGKKVEYYYRLTAGPGEVALTVDLKAKAGATSAEVEVFDEDANKIFYYYPNATSQNERDVKRITLSGKQNLTLRLALDGSAGEYSIKLAGAIELTPPVDASSPPDAAVSNAEQTQPANTSQSDTATDTPATKAGKPGKLTFGMNILQAVGTQFGLPTSGVLHLVMRDGTVQQIDLSKVKSASVVKP